MERTCSGRYLNLQGFFNLQGMEVGMNQTLSHKHHAEVWPFCEFKETLSHLYDWRILEDLGNYLDVPLEVSKWLVSGL